MLKEPADIGMYDVQDTIDATKWNPHTYIMPAGSSKFASCNLTGAIDLTYVRLMEGIRLRDMEMTDIDKFKRLLSTNEDLAASYRKLRDEILINVKRHSRLNFYVHQSVTDKLDDFSRHSNELLVERVLLGIEMFYKTTIKDVLQIITDHSWSSVPFYEVLPQDYVADVEEVSLHGAIILAVMKRMHDVPGVLLGHFYIGLKLFYQHSPCIVQPWRDNCDDLSEEIVRRVRKLGYDSLEDFSVEADQAAVEALLAQ